MAQKKGAGGKLQTYDEATGRYGTPAERKRLKELGIDEDVIRLPDEVIPRSVGAWWKNYEIKLPNGKIAKFAEGSRLQNIEVFAGKGCKRKIDEEDRLSFQYGYPKGSWMKVKAIGILVDEDGEERKAEVHWYEAMEGEKEEVKFKKWIN